MDSPIRPSDLPIAFDCTGSILLESEKTDVAAIGTSLHKIAEEAIRKSLESGKLVETKEKFLNEYIKFAFDAIKSKPDEYGIEKQLSDRFLNYILSGTCDFYFIKNGKVTVVDLKTGKKPMEEESLRQLMFYAVCLVKDIPDRNPVDLIYFTRYGKKLHRTMVWKLLEFKNKLCIKFKKISFNVGDHCKGCYKFNNCVVAKNLANELIERIKSGEKDENHYQFKGLIEKYFTNLKKEIMERVEKGDNKRFQIIERNWKKVWKTDRLNELYQNKQLVVRRLITVKEAIEGGLNVNKDMYEQLTYKILKERKREWI